MSKFLNLYGVHRNKQYPLNINYYQQQNAQVFSPLNRVMPKTA